MMAALELWGGVECTVNRVNDTFHNQLERSGHDRRCADLDRIAELGLRRLRYPVLWELTAPHAPDRFDWQWADERLPRLRALGIEPIVGLLHHGSGPRYTNLLDPRFAELFAAYARAVATRFPWIGSYTPINEPLTTARFSALYGHWYPHARDDRSFVRALLNQCRGTVLAMREIRRVNPAAQLIQTDDVGFTTSTARLAYQAAFDNERRWLAWDLLCGKVDCAHPLAGYLRDSGATEAELDFFRDSPCPPDVVGVNHYVTSDRHLHDDRQSFPPRTWGGNGRDAYADVEAIRVLADGPRGVTGALEDAWNRYRLPVAITEVHLGCTREEQLRWLWQTWNGSMRLRDQGMDVRAVTVWALLGSFDWNSLLTSDARYYECGAFDIRGPNVRPTAIARLTRKITSAASFQPMSVVKDHGWWQRQGRMLPALRVAKRPARLRQRNVPSTLMLTACNGVLGRAFERICEVRGIGTQALSRTEFATGDAKAITKVLDRVRPWALIDTDLHAAANTAAADRSDLYRQRREVASRIAALCAKRGIPFLTFSPSENRSAALVIRTGAVFGPWDRWNYLTAALRVLEAGRSVDVDDAGIAATSYVPDLVNTSLDLLLDGESGVWRLTNPGRSSFADVIRRAAELAGIGADGLHSHRTDAPEEPISSADVHAGEFLMPGIDDALRRYATLRWGRDQVVHLQRERARRNDATMSARPIRLIANCTG